MGNSRNRSRVTAVVAVVSSATLGCSAWMPVEGPLAQAADSDATALADGDLGTPYTGPPLSGCTPSKFVDRSAASADRTIYFGGQGGSGAFSYSPACIEIAAGQSVTWSGSFASHPLNPGTSPDNPTIGSPNNPIVSQQDSNSYEVGFPARGTYPFSCGVHFALGMLGAVQVN